MQTNKCFTDIDFVKICVFFSVHFVLNELYEYKRLKFKHKFSVF